MPELTKLALKEGGQRYNILWLLSGPQKYTLLAIRCNLTKLHITSANQNLYSTGKRNRKTASSKCSPLFRQHTKRHFLELGTAVFRNTRVLKSLEAMPRASSILAPGTRKKRKSDLKRVSIWGVKGFAISGKMAYLSFVRRQKVTNDNVAFFRVPWTPHRSSTRKFGLSNTAYNIWTFQRKSRAVMTLPLYLAVFY